MKTAVLLHHLIACLVCVFCQANALAQETIPQATSASTEQAPPAVATQVTTPESPTDSADGPSPPEATAMPGVVGTWSRAESGTFSKLAIRPVEHQERLFFVEWDSGNGLLKWDDSIVSFKGFFTFKLLGDRTTSSILRRGPNETLFIGISPFEDQRKQLLRSGFAKTQRELDQMLSSNWTRVESPAELKPTDTVHVVKAENAPARVRESLRTKYRDQPYRFFSNDTYKSAIVVAPADAQDDIEVALHQLDVPETATPTVSAAGADPVETAMPDISGSWYFNRSGEGPDNPMRALIRRLNERTADFVIEIAGSEEVKWPRLKWNSDAHYFESEVPVSDEEKVTKFTTTLTENGQTLRFVYAASEQDVRHAISKWSFAEEQVRELLKQEWKREVPEFAFPATEEIFVPLAEEQVRGLLRQKWKREVPAFAFSVAEDLFVPFGEARPASSETAPDIVGTWLVKSATIQDHKVSVSIPMEIRRVRQPGGNIDFLIDQPWAGDAIRINVQWNAAKGWFSGSHISSEDDAVWIWIRPTEDARTLHGFQRNKGADGELTTSETEWIFKSKSIATEFDPNDFGETLAAMYSGRQRQLTGDASSIPEPITPTQPKAIRRSLPASAEAQRLVEQLQAQESAAASEADAIRRLQNNGQNDSHKSAMAGHQRTLTSLLSTAFDLKMQLEELQVKELQARLSQLDRQIGQRKQLREKIIERRASELIEDKSLKWSPEGFSAKAQPVTASAGESSLTETDAISTEDITVDLYGGSGVLPGIKKLPRYNKLIRDLNGLEAVVTNFRVAGEGTSIAMATVRDPSQLCRRAMQRTNTESQLRLAINAALKAAGIENVRWDETKALMKDTRPTGTAREEPDAVPQFLESLRSPDEMRAELTPFQERIVQYETRVCRLEVVYFQDRSNASELQAALDELEQARAELQPHRANVERELQILFSEAEMSQSLVKAMEAQWHTRIESLSQGNATVADVRQASEAYLRAAASSQSLTSRAQEYESGLPHIYFSTNTDWMTAPAVSVDDSHPRLHPDVALAWLEGITGQKLELVQLDGLELPVTAALRARETSSRLEKDDLLVTLNGCRFESLDQAVVASRRSSNSHNSTVLRGGLGGQTLSRLFRKPSDDCLFPAEAGKALVKFELRVRRKADDDVEASYVNGVCVAMDGLAVIPVAASWLVVDAPIVTYSPFKGTAKVVASDEQRGLTLVKLEVPGQSLFQWVACQSALPTKGQRLLFYLHGLNILESTVMHVGLSYPEPLAGTDAFVMDSRNGALNITPIGSPMMSIKNELQGMLLAISSFAPDEKEHGPEHWIVPAVHSANLLDDYRTKKPPHSPLSVQPSQD